jgi:hypothetical protein
MIGYSPIDADTKTLAKLVRSLLPLPHQTNMGRLSDSIISHLISTKLFRVTRHRRAPQLFVA